MHSFFFFREVAGSDRISFKQSVESQSVFFGSSLIHAVGASCQRLDYQSLFWNFDGIAGAHEHFLEKVPKFCFIHQIW